MFAQRLRKTDALPAREIRPLEPREDHRLRGRLRARAVARLARLVRRPQSAARPVNDAIHSTGNYAVWLVVISLAVTPARRLFMAPKLINMRRTLGVAAFCYAVLHLTLYVVEQKYDLAKVVERDRVAHLSHHRLRRADRPDRARRDLDRRHDPAARRRSAGTGCTSIVYAIAILGIIHFLMQTKLDISESVMVAGFLFWLLGYRLMHRYRRRGHATSGQLALALIAAALTAVAEAAWYGATTGVMWWRVFSVNLDWDMALRPAHWVLIVGLGVTLAAFAWSFRLSAPRKPRKALGESARRAPSRSSPAADAAPR